MLSLPAVLPSRLILGTAHLSSGRLALPGLARGAAAFALLDKAIDLGIEVLDTAAVYQLGGSELVIGEWMRRRGVRDRIYLITKGGHPSIVGHSRLQRSDLERDLDGSLRRLGTDHVDLYLLHRDVPSRPLMPIADTLCSFVRDGRIGAYGVSNWTHERFAALHTLTSHQGMPLPIASSPQFSLPVWSSCPYRGCVSIGGSVVAGALRTYRATAAAVLAWSPLGGGWLRGSGGRARVKAYRGRANDARHRRLTALAKQIGCTPAQVALDYVLAHGSNVHAILGTHRLERLSELQAALLPKLLPDQLSWLANGAGGEAPPAGSQVVKP